MVGMEEYFSAEASGFLVEENIVSTSYEQL